ncbi:ABC transporter permease [Rhodovulum sp. DZ06]|uniref:ABC transporter permease n=1 Tax=Rhodovulum sp. DZ06 TaxID=3425126 RepID=UPI003D350C52
MTDPAAPTQVQSAAPGASAPLAAGLAPEAPGFGARRFGRWNALGAWTLCLREVRRFTNVWTQTLLGPVITAALFMAVFTLALGTRRGEVMGLPFAAFLAPGIVMMQVIQNSFANTASSILISKIQGNIVDTLMPPLSATELLIGYVFGGVARGMCVAAAAGLIAFSVSGVVPAHPLWLLWFAFAGGAMMSLLGILAGLFSQKFDQMQAFVNFVITPLSFLSGTFYTLDALPGWAQAAAHANPIFWLIDGFRHGALGVSDGSPWIGFAVTLGVIAALAALCRQLFHTGWRLKP